MFPTLASLAPSLKYDTQRRYIYALPAMLGKQISGFLLTVAVHQQLAYALPLDAAMNDVLPDPSKTWCSNGALPFVGDCVGSIFYCHAGYVGVAVGGCVRDGTGTWVPSRRWTSDEAMDYLLSGGSKIPPP